MRPVHTGQRDRRGAQPWPPKVSPNWCLFSATTYTARIRERNASGHDKMQGCNESQAGKVKEAAGGGEPELLGQQRSSRQAAA